MVEYRKYDKISIYFDPRFNEKEYRKYDKVSIYFDPRSNEHKFCDCHLLHVLMYVQAILCCELIPKRTK